MIRRGTSRGGPGLVAPVSAEGGFIEAATSTVIRPQLFAADLGFIPATRTAFTFPAPYGTLGWRITLPTDVGGFDGVEYNGYAFWNKMSHSGDFLYMVVGTNAAYPSFYAGANIYRLTKSTGVVDWLGPLFDVADADRAWFSIEMYFSPTLPTKLYYTRYNLLTRIDILTKVKTDVCDVRSAAAIAAIGTAGCTIDQAHTSWDENVHAFRVFSPLGPPLGVAVYHSNTNVWQFFAAPAPPGTSNPDERPQLDCSGQYVWIATLYADGGVTNRIVRLSDGRVTRPPNSAGHQCVGFRYCVGGFDPVDAAYPGYNLYDADQSPFTGAGIREVYRDASYAGNPAYPGHLTSSAGHVSWINAVNADPATQYALLSPECGTPIDLADPLSARINSPHANEFLCVKLDGSQICLVIAPTMTNISRTNGGHWGGEYAQFPKASLCMQGRYLLTTTNFDSPRLDAVLIRVPRNVSGWDI